jgi:hypothetical protein
VSAIVRRYFRIIVEDLNASPVEDAGLTLFDNYNRVLWSGRTNSSGEATFGLEFADGNYTDTLVLEAMNENRTAEEDIAFLSSTPIILQLSTSIAADVNGDGRVDMKDIGYVARRFMCVPSDPLWDSIADLNSDGKIDMKDISTVARHFGEHYP